MTTLANHSAAGKRGGLLVLASLLWMSAPVQAELSALVHDRVDDSLRAVSIDSGNGAVTPGSASVEACCLVGAGLTAADVDGGRFFAFGRYLAEDGFGDDVLMSFDFDGNAAATVAPVQAPYALLAYDAAQDRLISTEPEIDDIAPTLQWVAFDPDDGSVSPIGAPDSICCELLTGIAALSEADQQLYFVGRLFGESEWRIRSVDLANASITDVAALPAPGRPGFMRYSAGSGQLDVYMQDGAGGDAGMFRVDPANGSAVSVAPELDPDCCLLGLGEIASLDQAGEAWWAAGSGSGLSPIPGFLALNAASTSAAVTQRAIASDYAIHALVVSGEVVSPGLIFRDRFQVP